MPTTRRVFVGWTGALLLLALLILVAIIGTGFWLGIRTQASFDGILAARTLRAAIIDLRGSLQDLETSQRGFLLTGRELYLQPYTNAKAAIPAQLDHASSLVAGDPELAHDWADAKLAIAAKLDELAKTIELKQSGNSDAALAVVNTDTGKAAMDKVRVDFNNIVDVSETRLGAAVASQRSSSAWLSFVSIGGAAIVLLAFAAAAWTVLRYTRELAAAQAEVTELNKGLEVRVSERTADLLHANEEIQRFAYIVTHDLRAPLVNIMGFTAELEAGLGEMRTYLAKIGTPASDPGAAEAYKVVDADMPEAIGFIRSSTKKMDGLISAVLKLAREGGRTVRPEQIQLGELLENAVDAIRHQVTEADGDVKVDVDVPPMTGDRLALEQIFGNLLDNAVKYRSPKRPLHILISGRKAPGDKVRLIFSDNGRGIDPKDHERVFELFRRSGAQNQPGEGIGLAYVRTIVRNVGGEIRLASELDRGTTFTLTLPRTLPTLHERGSV